MSEQNRNYQILLPTYYFYTLFMSVAIKSPAPLFSPKIDFKVFPQEDLERSTIVHCSVSDADAIRIWPSTFLVQDNGDRKKLLHAFHISPYPNWTFVEGDHTFTLVFEGLDKSCLLFDLYEDIPEAGGFYIENIERNKTDVYHLDVSGY